MWNVPIGADLRTQFGFGLSYTEFEYSNIQIERVGTDPYVSSPATSGPAPTYGTIDNDTASHVFPANFTRVPLFIYPWLNSTNLSASYGHTDFGDNSFIPEGALDGSSFTTPAAGGAPGGNPQLWDVLYRVTATVSNVGSVAGSEIAQLYVSLGGPYDPKVVLRGFEKLSVQPNGSATASFDLLRRDVSNWDTVSQNWIVSNYSKTVYVGPSSRTLPLSVRL
jgi:beta-glucosidase